MLIFEPSLTVGASACCLLPMLPTACCPPPAAYRLLAYRLLAYCLLPSHAAYCLLLTTYPLGQYLLFLIQRNVLLESLAIGIVGLLL
jgi:hypothetical protein